jgi:hypothetical protein
MTELMTYKETCALLFIESWTVSSDELIRRAWVDKPISTPEARP